MIKEIYDKKSGAILFKKDEESLTVDELVKIVHEQSKTIMELKEEIDNLKK